jgi:uncharacterized protein YkwD
MSIIQPVLSDQNIIDITEYINTYRMKNQAPPLVWDDVIKSFSQSWTYYMSINNLIQHSGSPIYGENIEPNYYGRYPYYPYYPYPNPYPYPYQYPY